MQIHDTCLASVCLSIAAMMSLGAPTLAAKPKATELSKCTAWAKQSFARAKVSATKSPKQAPNALPSLLVANNYGALIKDVRPDGRPLKIGDTEFKRGLLCHAASKVVVRLPGPGKSFTSTVGVDANSGGGSVVFSVIVGGKEAFNSGTMKGSAPGVPVSVALGGAREFTIAASDAGDGISSDHADWADAKVTLSDGKELYLSDLPVLTSDLPQRLASAPPFRFMYDGKPSDALLPTWEFTTSSKKLDANRNQRTQVYTDPKTGLQVRVVSVAYKDFPTIEWTVYLKNAGKSDTPIIQDIQALDTEFVRPGSAEFKLHHSRGSETSPQDYEPIADVMGPDARKRITGAVGWPTRSDLSYFNIELSKQEGVILAVGWSGQWSGEFVRDEGKKLRVVCGQELTHLKLHPGEEIRTPMIVMQFWQGGDWIDAQNTWRRWMVAHNLPHPGGKPIAPQYGGCFGNMVPTAAEEIAEIDAYYADGVKMDHWIIDAGWYPCGDSWWWTGNWEYDKTRFPKGLREVADHVHAKGMDFIIWFEPERVGDGNSWLAKNHPDWILGGQLVNMGNPEARKWVIDMVDGMMVSQGIDHYRGDYNIGALPFWRGNDTEDRQGMTENLYVQGFRIFWDELLRRDPKRYLDTCAGGGGRNDVETLRRSVPLLRSDFWAPNIDHALGMQAQSYGVALWMPYTGTGAACCDIYTLRSAYCPAYRIGYNGLDPKRNKDLMLQAVREINLLKPYWLSDYYPLTPYNRNANEWIAWQFDSPEKGGGFVQAFRRDDCSDASMTFKLRGLDPKSDYLFTNLDDNKTQKVAGKVLLSEGLQVTISAKPGAAVLMYKKAK